MNRFQFIAFTAYFERNRYVIIVALVHLAQYTLAVFHPSLSLDEGHAALHQQRQRILPVRVARWALRQLLGVVYHQRALARWAAVIDV